MSHAFGHQSARGPGARGRVTTPGAAPPRAALARDLVAPMRRATELALRGDHVGAERRLRAVIERAPDLAEAHHHLAVVLHGMGKTVEALRSLRHGLDLDPHLVGAEARLERYLAELDERRGA